MRRSEEDKPRASKQDDDGSGDRPEPSGKHQKIPGREAGIKRRIDLILSQESLGIIKQTIADAESHSLLHASDNAPEQLDNLPEETKRFRWWRDQRLGPTKAKQRSNELQMMVRWFHSSDLQS